MPCCDRCPHHPKMKFYTVDRHFGASGGLAKKALGQAGHPTLALITGIVSGAVGAAKIFFECVIYRCPRCGATKHEFRRKKR